jgi:hypothetical protein
VESQKLWKQQNNTHKGDLLLDERIEGQFVKEIAVFCGEWTLNFLTASARREAKNIKM